MVNDDWPSFYAVIDSLNRKTLFLCSFHKLSIGNFFSKKSQDGPLTDSVNVRARVVNMREQAG